MKKEISDTDDEQLSLIQRKLSSLSDPFDSVMFQYLSNEELINFSTTCKQINDCTLFEWGKRKAACTLLLAVVQGNESEEKRLLEINYRLLSNTKGEVSDHFNRTFRDLTTFQTALCTGDVEMCKMMKEYFAMVEKGQVMMENQFDIIFPHGIEVHVQNQKESVFDFNEILKAIGHAQENEVIMALNKEFNNDLCLHQALGNFRKEFFEKSLSERVFNPHHLLRAFQIYYDEFENLGNESKRDLFLRQIIGFVQRSLPVCYLQAILQGIRSILYKGTPFQRSSNEILVFPKGASGLGFDFMIDCEGVKNTKLGPNGADFCYQIFQKYVEQKHQALKDKSFLMQRCEDGVPVRCVIQ